MDKIPSELWLRIFSLLDHSNLAAALQVCRRWNMLASDSTLWCKLFQGRWGTAAMEFFSPDEPSSSSSSSSSKTWKDVYEVQDRCDRVGIGLKIIREGKEYYLVHKGEIQRCLGSTSDHGKSSAGEEKQNDTDIAKKILFFIGDLETASSQGKRARR